MHLNSEQNHQGLGPDLPIRRKLAEQKHSLFSSMDATALTAQDSCGQEDPGEDGLYPLTVSPVP